ncbi:MAG: DUF790 family protein [Polyangiaceae bacterium]
MLTADLVNARRRGRELHLVSLDAQSRERARAVASTLVGLAVDHVGRSRDDLALALSSVDVGPREVRLRDGLAKLIEDRCEFESACDEDPPELRRDVFTRASATRSALDGTTRFDRSAIIAQVAGLRGSSSGAVEAGLFADLRGAQRLTAFDAPSAEALVTRYEHAQAQAVLLRAVRVVVDVRCASAGTLRALFRKVKFLRLLHAVEKRDGGHRIIIDGPFSLFESVTKYGLQLALVLPALEECDSWQLEAEVRWGKEREPLAFRLAGRGGPAQAGATEPPLPDDVATLVASFKALGTSWRVSQNSEILDLPGVGLSVPDLVFERPFYGPPSDRVFFEVMGYWSRAAVWKRVELVQAGLAAKVLFAVSSRLRVSEEVLGGDLPSALYVFKQTMSARAIAERIDRLAVPRATT